MVLALTLQNVFINQYKELKTKEMADYKTPGVYVVEKDSFGSSIVANETAIPVFIGFTEQALQSDGQELNFIKGSNNVREPILVNSVLEYQQTFGGADTTGLISLLSSYDSSANKTNYISRNLKKSGTGLEDYAPGLMYPSISNYFANGGGSCYIISIGNYNEFSASNFDPVNIEFITEAIAHAAQATLIVPTDLIRYGSEKYYEWGTNLIEYCGKEKTLFCVLDVIQAKPNDSVYDPKDVDKYRNGVAPDATSYAATYFPYLRSMTSYAYYSDLTGIILNGYNLGEQKMQFDLYSGAGLSSEKAEIFTFSYSAPSGTKGPKLTLTTGAKEVSFVTATPNEMVVSCVPGSTAADLNLFWSEKVDIFPDWNIDFLMNPEVPTSTKYVQDGNWNTEPATVNDFPFTVTFNQLLITDAITTPLSKVQVAVEVQSNPNIAETIITYDKTDGMIITMPNDAMTAIEIVGAFTSKPTDPFTFEATEKNSSTIISPIAAAQCAIEYDMPNNASIEDAKKILSTNYINMPPSPFMAGIYSRMDNASGVWTPPANISPAGVIEPVVHLTSKEQENLNVDAYAGKSINAIRSFTGKGTLVWGARTNDGNSLDWRYINVRRLFISMETDISMALEAYVFKPNVHNTWIEIKTMIESYLFGLYNDGAFAGTTPETSYQVLVGQGVTMTDEDILNGYIRVSIQVAPVRPAEFIVLTFTQMVGQ